MPSIDICELQQNAPELLKRVRDEQVTLEITCGGEAIARLMPILYTHQSDAIWATLEQISAETAL